MAAKIKVYRPHGGYASGAALRVAGVPEYRTQGDVFVAAYTKDAAIEYANALNFGGARGEWHVATPGYNALVALLDAGLLATEGEVLVIARNHPTTVARFDRPTGLWKAVGAFEYRETNTTLLRAGVADRRVVLTDETE